MKIDAPCQYLDWDSAFFGQKIARCTTTNLTEEVLSDVLRWCGNSGIDCLYFLADASDETTVRLAECSGFQFVDIRVTLNRQIQDSKIPDRSCFEGHVRSSLPEDVPILSTIAKSSHSNSRFYFDCRFPPDKSAELYATWIEKSCKGYADIVFVAEDSSRLLGYISCHLLDDQRGAIGLLGVAVDSRGKEVGMALVSTALDWFMTQSIKEVEVVTQATNISAQRLYQKNGFRTSLVQLWYHLWFPKS